MKGTGSRPFSQALPAQSGTQIQITHKKMFVEELLKGPTSWNKNYRTEIHVYKTLRNYTK